MAEHTLSSLLAGTRIMKTRGNADTPVGGISYDSRRVSRGDVFFAIEGEHTDGHRYISDALSAGAAAIVHSKRIRASTPDVPCIHTDSPRRALSAAAAALYGHPSKSMYCVGITGTDGKSTTTYMLYQILCALGIRAGFLSTVYVDTGTGVRKNPLRQSTPEAPEVHALLAEMRDNGMTHAVVEATSHGLSEKTHRLTDIWWKGAVMTNINHEHLEFHGSFERYLYDKTRLFSGLERVPDVDAGGGEPFGDFAVINSDDPNASAFQNATNRRLFLYSPSGSPADVRARSVQTGPDGIRFTVEVEGGRHEAFIPLAGVFNVANALAAVIAAHRATGHSWETVIGTLPGVTPLPGRMQQIDESQGFSVIVDFAHTPASFEQVLPAAIAETEGRLIVVFGSAGERDTQKRKLQGQVADQYADTIILTDEDPRGEDPRKILDDIASACKHHRNGENLHLVPDRREAIRRALSLASAGDTVLLLGKGHESSIIYHNRTVEWDEAGVAREILNDMGYRNG
ncbi:MAG: UDP-N-acetylmuramoyl-L-alanyl-D-glutamate--2,6-diaminopimelate ligase [Spirochaetia bacterium]